MARHSQVARMAAVGAFSLAVVGGAIGAAPSDTTTTTIPFGG